MDHASEMGVAKIAVSRLTSWSRARLNCSMLPVSNDTTVVVGSALEVVLELVGGGVLEDVCTLDVELLVGVAELVLDDVRCDVLCVVDVVVGAGGGGGGVLVGCWCVVDVGFGGTVVCVGGAPPPKFHAP